MIDERAEHTREALTRANTTGAPDTRRQDADGRAVGDDPAASVRGAGRVAVDGGRRTGIDVLHVEPDPRAAELLRAFVAWAEEEVRVRSADHVADALDLVIEVDCVVTEQRLPDGTGIDLVDRAREHGVRTPVLFHTTCHDARVESRAIAAGADAYLRKRSNRGQYDRLLAAIRAHATSPRSSNVDPGPSRPERTPRDAPGSTTLPARSEE